MCVWAVFEWRGCLTSERFRLAMHLPAMLKEWRLIGVIGLTGLVLICVYVQCLSEEALRTLSVFVWLCAYWQCIMNGF